MYFENVGRGSYSICVYLHLHSWLLAHDSFIMHVRARAQCVENGVFGLRCIIHLAFAKCTCLLVCPGRANACRWGVRLVAPLIGSRLTETWPLQQMSVRFQRHAQRRTRTHTHTIILQMFLVFFGWNVLLLFSSSGSFALKKLLRLLEVLNTIPYCLACLSSKN